ncbi:MAG: glucose-6-phosphate isomerase [Phycisphaeraceae bacterium]|nr:glucose-6-phosphate isomerase [Phycisphaeraceae bacterium]
MPSHDLYQRYQQLLCPCPGLGIRLDISRMDPPEDFFRNMEPAVQSAFEAMDALEGGAIANPDENRMVGHYWLRAPAPGKGAPDPAIAAQITKMIDDVERFAADVHQKKITPPNAAKFTDLLLIGIGGSALGPQLIADALGNFRGRDRMAVHFLDNTDPDGIARTIRQIGARLKSTLVLVVSKSGGTPETRNGMIETQAAFKAKNFDFAKQAVAVTGEGSKLDQEAASGGWLARFPMWDFIGGRTSVMAAVGLLPAALQGLKIRQLLDGAAKMDKLTRSHNTAKNPAALLALMWHYATAGRGEKDMVILPYKDRLLLLSRYLQQLVMESLGKEKDLNGAVVHQGIAVYGNKGSTDQHAYVQQLREGVNNFFVTFIVIAQDHPAPGRSTSALEVEPGITSGDYLHGFYLGTRQALYENGRGSMSILCDKLDARTLGALIGLYERAVGLYASLVNINAYHQPGVEAGKKAAAAVLDLQKKAVACLRDRASEALTAEQIAQAIGAPDVETIEHICEHLAANGRLQQRKAAFQFKS